MAAEIPFNRFEPPRRLTCFNEAAANGRGNRELRALQARVRLGLQ